MNKKLTLLLITSALFLSGCFENTLSRRYNEYIDTEITAFSEKFNTHIKNMRDLGGTEAGTYEKNIQEYNALESKLDSMIDKSELLSESKSCKLEAKLYEKIKSMFKNNGNIPAELQTATSAKEGDTYSCNSHLIRLVKKQLGYVREIHQSADQCETPDSTEENPKTISCLREATSKSITAIANQSIRAVSVVEAARK